MYWKYHPQITGLYWQYIISIRSCCSIKKNDLYQLCPCEDPFYELSGHLSENPVVVGQLTIITCGANTYSLCWCWYWAHQVGQPFRWQCGAPALDSRAKLREDALMGTNYKARRASWAKSCYKGKANSKPAVSTSERRSGNVALSHPPDPIERQPWRKKMDRLSLILLFVSCVWDVTSARFFQYQTTHVF